jgi:hypothetical protein
VAGLLQRLRARPALLGWAVAAVCAGCALLPLIVARTLPLLDQPNHLGAIAIWHHYGDPRFGFAEHYQLNIHPVPYLGYYGAVHLLAYLMPIEAANKLFLAATILGFPLGLRAYLRASGRPEILALAALPLAWSFNLALGFTAYVASVALVLYGWALLARFADARPRPGWGLWAANLAVGLAIYFLHPLGVMLWLVGVLVYAGWRAPLLGAGPIALFAYQLLSAPAQGLRAAEVAHRIDGRWNSFAANVRLLLQHLWDFLRPEHRWHMTAALVVALLLGAVLVVRSGARDRRPTILAAAVLLLYFVLPEHLYRPVNWWMVNGRLAIVIAMLLFVCVAPGRLAGWRAALVALPLVLATIVYSVNIARRFAAFDRKTADFDALVERLPYNPSVLTIIYPPLWDPTVWCDPWRQFPSYIQLRRGGYNPWSWGDGFPMRTREAARKPAPEGHHPEKFDYAAHAAAYEYLLVRGEPPGTIGGKPGVTLVEERGMWRLYRNPGAR